MVWIIFNNQPEEWRVDEIILSHITSPSTPMPQYRLRHVGLNHCGSTHEITLWEYQVYATRRELALSLIDEK